MVTTLTQSVQNAAMQFPDHEAFRFGQQSLAYGDLNKRTNQIAHYLLERGVQKGDRVGVYMYRCLETALAIYGIMKAGGVFVPLDPSQPVKRISFLLNDCDIQMLLTTPNLHKKIKKIIEQDSPLKSVVGLDAEASISNISWDSVFSDFPDDSVDVSISGDDLAYIMYTSGSTGYPKGIMHSHYSGLKYAELSMKEFNVKKEDRIANHAPLHFDISTMGYLTAPLASATTVIVSEAHTKMPHSLAELIEKEQITIWYSVPLALVQMLQANALQDKEISKLRLVLFGGEVFPNKYLATMMHLCPQTSFYNVYGPAEINQCTCHLVEKPPALDADIPIGKVWDETHYLLLDEHDHPVKRGEQGELVVSTATMMKGYWNNIPLTEKSLFHHTGTDKTGIYFRTGDLAKEDKQGLLLFLGRKDRQVKIRGYRIEIDEIEAVILRHEKVLETATVVNQTKDGEKEIVAAVILRSEERLEENTIIKHCREHLPAYAVPKKIMFLNDFPRTGSGKTDRIELLKSYANA